MGKVKIVDIGSGRVVGCLKQVPVPLDRRCLPPARCHLRHIYARQHTTTHPLTPQSQTRTLNSPPCLQCQGSVRAIDIHATANLVAAVGLDRWGQRQW